MTAVLELPRALGFADLAAADLGEWTCELADSRHVSCVAPRLAVGDTLALSVPVRASAATSGKATVTVAAGNRPGVTITSDVEPKVPSAGLAARGIWTGAYAVTEIGAPVLTCDPSASDDCATARNNLGGSAINNSMEMIPLDNSSATLKASGDIVFAGLYWSGNKHADDTWTGPLTEVQVTAPGSKGTAVGTVVSEVTDSGNRTYYQSFADVTSIVTRQGNVSVDGVAVAATRNDPTPSYYGGWALVVVYADPDADREVAVYDGGAWISTNSSMSFAFATEGDATTRVGVVGWEGDRGVNGKDQLMLDGTTALTPVRADGSAGSANDAFTSTAWGFRWNNTFGVDAKAFGEVELSEGVHSLTASTGSDQYLIGAVTVTTTPR